MIAILKLETTHDPFSALGLQAALVAERYRRGYVTAAAAMDDLIRCAKIRESVADIEEARRDR